MLQPLSLPLPIQPQFPSRNPHRFRPHWRSQFLNSHAHSPTSRLHESNIRNEAPHAHRPCASPSRLRWRIVCALCLATLSDPRSDGRHERGLHLHPHHPSRLSVVFHKTEKPSQRHLRRGVRHRWVVYELRSEAMMERMGVSWALRITAIIIFLMNLPAVLLIRNRTDYIHPQQRDFDLELLRRYDVFLLLLWSFVSMFGYIILTFSLPSYAISIGLSVSKASSIAAFLNLGMAIGSPLIGIAGDIFGITRVATLLTFSCGFLCFALWIPSQTYEVLAMFALLSGTIVGVFWAVIFCFFYPSLRFFL